MQIVRRLPRRGGKPIIPNLRPMDGDFSWFAPEFGSQELVIPVELTGIFLKWIDILKATPYVVEVLNGTDTPIAVVWTYLLNELTAGGDIVTVGPYSSTWLGLLPGATAVFELTGCLYMKSYAITVVYEGQPDVVLPNTSIDAINQYELEKFGSINTCSDWWEIYI